MLRLTTRAIGRVRQRRLWLMVGGAVAVALGAAGAVAIAGVADEQSARRDQNNRARVTTTADGTTIARRVDRRRGLVFEIQSSTALFASSDLYVTLTRDAPHRTRALLFRRPLAATCDVPGQHMREFAGRWDTRFRRFGTALLPDDPDVNVARLATVCALFIGREGATEGTADFPDTPFSRVPMR